MLVIVLCTLPLCYGFYSCHRAMDRSAAKDRAAADMRRKIEAEVAQSRIAAAIKQKQLLIGMSRDQVIAAWGRPQDINRTITPGHISEQYCYAEGRFAYLEDGILTTIQD